MQQAVAVDRGHLERRDALVGKQGDGVQCIRPWRGGNPAAADGLTVANVDRDCHPFRPVFLDQCGGEGGVAEGGRAHHGARGSCREDCPHGVGRPEAARGLDLDLPADGGSDGSNDRGVGRGP